MMLCDRCDMFFCVRCLDISDSVYQFLSKRDDMLWLCGPCRQPALNARKTDVEIEQKCA